MSVNDPAAASPRPPVTGNAKAMAAAIVAVAFVTGVFIGVAGDRAYLIHARRLMPGPRVQRGMTDRMLRHLDRELHFTPEQRAHVQAILEQHRKKMDAIMSGVRPQMQAEIDDANRQIDALLDAEQKKTFAAMRARMANRQHPRVH